MRTSIIKFIDDCVARIARKIEDEFVERDHPRDDDGKFKNKNSGSSRNIKLEYEEEIDKATIWENIKWVLKENGLRVKGGEPDSSQTSIVVTSDSGKEFVLPIEHDKESSVNFIVHPEDVKKLLKGGGESSVSKARRELSKSKTYLTKLYNKIKYTQQEKDAAKEYTSHFSNKINRALRRKAELKGRMSDIVNDLDSIISKNKLTKPITVYRKGPLSMLGLKSGATLEDVENSVGTVLLDRAYMSSSINPNDETAESDDTDTSVQMIMEVPPGDRGAYIAPMSGYEGEEEYLLKRGTYYKVKSVTPASESDIFKYIVKVEVIDAPKIKKRIR